MKKLLNFMKVIITISVETNFGSYRIGEVVRYSKTNVNTKDLERHQSNTKGHHTKRKTFENTYTKDPFAWKPFASFS